LLLLLLLPSLLPLLSSLLLQSVARTHCVIVRRTAYSLCSRPNVPRASTVADGFRTAALEAIPLNGNFGETTSTLATTMLTPGRQGTLTSLDGLRTPGSRLGVTINQQPTQLRVVDASGGISITGDSPQVESEQLASPRLPPAGSKQQQLPPVSVRGVRARPYLPSSPLTQDGGVPIVGRFGKGNAWTVSSAEAARPAEAVFESPEPVPFPTEVTADAAQPVATGAGTVHESHHDSKSTADVWGRVVLVEDEPEQVFPVGRGIAAVGSSHNWVHAGRGKAAGGGRPALVPINLQAHPGGAQGVELSSAFAAASAGACVSTGGAGAMGAAAGSSAGHSDRFSHPRL
jgi:hypothetical protein